MIKAFQEDFTAQVTLSKPRKREAGWRKRVLKPKYAAIMSILFIVSGLGPLSPRVLAQSAWPAAVVTRSSIELNGWSMIADSFDSSDPNHSTNGQYDPVKAKDNGDVITAGGITNSFTTGTLHAYGHIHSAPSTNVPSIGSGGGVGSHIWQFSNTGIEPGWWLQDGGIANSSIAFPNTNNFLTATNGVLALVFGANVYTNSYDNILWGSQSSTNYYVADELSGQTIVIGPNVVLALPNGLTMSGQDSITLSSGTNIVGGTYAPASLTIYSGGDSCTIGGNGINNEPGFATDFRLFCPQSVTSVALNGNGSFVGVIAAPDARVSLNGAGSSAQEFVGALEAASVQLNGNFNLHYDESLFGTTRLPSSCSRPPAGLVTWWTGDGSGDDTSGHHDALIFGGTTFAPGKVGEAFSFNGVDAFIRTNAIATAAIDNWSIAAWVNWNGVTGAAGKQKQTLMYNGNESGNGYGLIIPEQGLCSTEPTLCSEVGKLVIEFGGVSYIPTGVVLSSNTWDHISLVRDSGVLKLYQDGTLVFASPSLAPNPPSMADGYTTVGGAPEYAFNGLVDEVMFSDTAIPGDQVASMFLAGELGACKPLVIATPTRSTNGLINIQITGQAGKSITIYGSSDLFHWFPLSTIVNPQGMLQFTDTNAVGIARRFYEAAAH